MKLRKMILIIGVCSICSAFACAGMAACGDSEGNSAYGNTYTLEAEHTDVDDLVLPGSSGTIYAENAIVESSKASNGYYISCLNGEGSTLTFHFESSAAGKATFKAKMNSGINGKMTFSDDALYIKVNGIKIEYDSFELKSVSAINPDFTVIDFGEIDLKAGANTIEFVAGDNDYNRGASGGPAIDCITLGTDATLTWEKLNTNLVGQ